MDDERGSRWLVEHAGSGVARSRVEPIEGPEGGRASGRLWGAIGGSGVGSPILYRQPPPRALATAVDQTRLGRCPPPPP